MFTENISGTKSHWIYQEFHKFWGVIKTWFCIGNSEISGIYSMEIYARNFDISGMCQNIVLYRKFQNFR